MAQVENALSPQNLVLDFRYSRSSQVLKCLELLQSRTELIRDQVPRATVHLHIALPVNRRAQEFSTMR